MSNKAKVGDIVLYVPEPDSTEAGHNNNAKGAAAIVVAAPDDQPGVASLRVFSDSVKDTWRPLIKYSEGEEPNTWHFPAA